MTQVKEMTNPELNRKLAELMGYSMYHYDKDYNCYFMLIDPEGDYQQQERETESEAWEDAPYYCTDPAASLEVERQAIKVDADGYISNLQEFRKLSQDKFMTRVMAAQLMLATPRERSEAAYSVLSGQNNGA